mgnify:CR=1 FL=1
MPTCPCPAQVNVSLLLDVLSNLRAMLRSDSGTRMATDVALHCVHATLRMLSGHGQALSVDQKDLQLRLFEALHEPEVRGHLRTELVRAHVSWGG